MKNILRLSLLAIFFGSCQAAWNDDDKKAFYQACTERASTWASSPEQAQNYCDCVFGKMAKKYPNEEDALEHLDKLAVDTDLINCRDEIVNQKATVK
jgi:hypothetical protein